MDLFNHCLRIINLIKQELNLEAVDEEAFAVFFYSIPNLVKWLSSKSVGRSYDIIVQPYLKKE